MAILPIPQLTMNFLSLNRIVMLATGNIYANVSSDVLVHTIYP